jgi:hypothetical protein
VKRGVDGEVVNCIVVFRDDRASMAYRRRYPV